MKTPIETRAVHIPAPDGEGAAPVTIEIFAISDVGRTREHNEDAFLVSDLDAGEALEFAAPQHVTGNRHGILFMVADGMGGAAAGELASATAVEVVLRYLRDQWTPSGGEPARFVEALEKATDMANGAIYRFASEHVEFRGMGTTATLAGLLGDTLYLAQVGDSRAYIIRAGVARQITKDQSLMQKLIEAGEISEEEAEVSDRRNIILQALGPEAAIKIDLTYQRVSRGDVLLLCSDGLSGLVRPEAIARVFREEPDLQRAALRLIELANALGGPDNITVVAARFDGEGLAPPPAAPGSDEEVGHHTFEIPGRDPSTSGAVEAMMRERTQQVEAMLEKTPPELPAAVRAERQELSRVVRGVLAAAAVVLGGYLVWRLLQLV